MSRPQTHTSAQTGSAASSASETKLTTGLLFLLASLAALGTLATNILLPAFPQMALDLKVSVRDLGATLSSFFAAYAAGQLFIGPLSDRFGRRPLVLIGLTTFIVGSVVCVFAVTLPQMIVGRVIQALGVCSTSVLARAIARDLFDGNALARTLSLVMVAMAAAPGFSPLLGSALNELIGWRLTFVAVGALALIAGVRYVMHLGETHAPEKRSPLSIPMVIGGYKRLVLDRRFIWPSLAASFVVGSLYTFFALAPNVLMTDFQLSSLEFGLFFAATVLVVFAGGLLAPRGANRWGPVFTARMAAVVALAGGAILLAGPPTMLTFTAGLTVFLFGMGIFNPLAATIALQPFGEQAGAASAMLGFLQMSCAALAVALGGMLDFSAFTTLATILSTAAAMALAIFFRVR